MARSLDSAIANARRGDSRPSPYCRKQPPWAALLWTDPSPERRARNHGFAGSSLVVMPMSLSTTSVRERNRCSALGSESARTVRVAPT
jgi:hypothetical protein